MSAAELGNHWQLWAHLPHDTNWTESSYHSLGRARTVAESVALSHALPDQMVKNCMLFWMRGDVKPMWEDPENRKGGAFSYRIPNRAIPQLWRKLTFLTHGECLDATEADKDVMGITISPKKTFCVIKIWTRTCDNNDPTRFAASSGLEAKDCMFKKHDPQF